MLSLVLTMSACGDKKRIEPNTALELVNQAIASMNELHDNYSVNMEIAFDLQMDMEVEKAKIDVSVPFTVIANADIANQYTHGNIRADGSMDVKMEYEGELQTQTDEINESVEFYIDASNNEIITYVHNEQIEDDGWQKNVSSSIKLPSYQLVLQPSLFENAKMEKLNDNYIVAIQLSDLINHPEFQKIVNTNALSELIDTDLDIATLVNAFGNAIVTYTFDSDCRLISMTTGKINLNLSSAIDTSDFADLGLTDIDNETLRATISIDVQFSQFGKITSDAVQPTSDVLTLVSDEKVEMPDNEVGKPNDTEQDDVGVSKKWTDMDIKVDGVVYHYPYDYSKFADHGWFVDLEVSDYTTTPFLNPNEETYTTIDLFHNSFNNPSTYDGMMAYVGFRNLNNEKTSILECPIWSIDLNISYGASLVPQYPNVIIANGITWGSTEDQVLNAFGTPSEMYESPSGEREFKSLTWHTDDHSKTMEITIDKEFGVIAISYATYTL